MRSKLLYREWLLFAPCLLLILAGFILHGRAAPRELVIESIQTHPVSSAEAKSGYDTKIAVTVRSNGTAPQFLNLKYTGGSIEVWNQHLVRRIGTSERPIAWHDPSATQISEGDEAVISFRFKQAQLPPGPGDIVLKADLKSFYDYNVHQGGKAIRSVAHWSPGVPVAIIVKHGNQ